jgi:hypothetical protein
VDKNWRPIEWANPYQELAGQLPYDALPTAFEVGASAIIEPVRKETLREVGRWLRRRRPKLCNPDYYFYLSVGKDELEVFERGEMPEEEK